MDISTLLKFACEQDASDLHISAGETPILRVHGDMKHVSTDVLDAQETRKMIYDIMNDYQRKIFEENNDVDFSIEFGEMARFRVNVFCQQRGLGAVFRKIPYCRSPGKGYKYQYQLPLTYGILRQLLPRY